MKEILSPVHAGISSMRRKIGENNSKVWFLSLFLRGTCLLYFVLCSCLVFITVPEGSLFTVFRIVFLSGFYHCSWGEPVYCISYFVPVWFLSLFLREACLLYFVLCSCLVYITVPEGSLFTVFRMLFLSGFYHCFWGKPVYCISYCVPFSSCVLDITFNLQIYAEIQIALHTRKVYA